MRQSPKNIVSAQLELDIRRDHRVAPSNIAGDFWFGTWARGEVLSREQQRELAGAEAEAITVYVVATSVWVPAFPGPFSPGKPYRAIVCPIVGKRGEKIKVIAPNGYAKFVYPDGYLMPERAGKWRRTA